MDNLDEDIAQTLARTKELAAGHLTVGSSDVVDTSNKDRRPIHLTEGIPKAGVSSGSAAGTSCNWYRADVDPTVGNCLVVSVQMSEGHVVLYGSVSPDVRANKHLWRGAGRDADMVIRLDDPRTRAVFDEANSVYIAVVSMGGKCAYTICATHKRRAIEHDQTKSLRQMLEVRLNTLRDPLSDEYRQLEERAAKAMAAQAKRRESSQLWQRIREIVHTELHPSSGPSLPRPVRFICGPSNLKSGRQDLQRKWLTIVAGLVRSTLLEGVADEMQVVAAEQAGVSKLVHVNRESFERLVGTSPDNFMPQSARSGFKYDDDYNDDDDDEDGISRRQSLPGVYRRRRSTRNYRRKVSRTDAELEAGMQDYSLTSQHVLSKVVAHRRQLEKSAKIRALKQQLNREQHHNQRVDEPGSLIMEALQVYDNLVAADPKFAALLFHDDASAATAADIGRTRNKAAEGPPMKFGKPESAAASSGAPPPPIVKPLDLQAAGLVDKSHPSAVLVSAPCYICGVVVCGKRRLTKSREPVQLVDVPAVRLCSTKQHAICESHVQAMLRNDHVTLQDVLDGKTCIDHCPIPHGLTTAYEDAASALTYRASNRYRWVGGDFIAAGTARSTVSPMPEFLVERYESPASGMFTSNRPPSVTVVHGHAPHKPVIIDAPRFRKSPRLQQQASRSLVTVSTASVPPRPPSPINNLQSVSQQLSHVLPAPTQSWVESSVMTFSAVSPRIAEAAAALERAMADGPATTIVGARPPSGAMNDQMRAAQARLGRRLFQPHGSSGSGTGSGTGSGLVTHTITTAGMSAVPSVPSLASADMSGVGSVTSGDLLKGAAGKPPRPKIIVEPGCAENTYTATRRLAKRAALSLQGKQPVVSVAAPPPKASGMVLQSVLIDSVGGLELEAPIRDRGKFAEVPVAEALIEGMTEQEVNAGRLALGFATTVKLQTEGQHRRL